MKSSAVCTETLSCTCKTDFADRPRRNKEADCAKAPSAHNTNTSCRDVVRKAHAKNHAVFIFGCPTHPAPVNSCNLFLHSDTLVGQYFSAMLCLWNVSAFSIQLSWRASPRAGSFISKKKHFIKIFASLANAGREAARALPPRRRTLPARICVLRGCPRPRGSRKFYHNGQNF